MQKFLFRINASRKSCRRFSSVATAACGITQKSSSSYGFARLRVKHCTTLFYSSVIATAAAVDVKAKQQRRTHWAKIIAEAESALTTNNPESTVNSQGLQSSTIASRAEDEGIDVSPTSYEINTSMTRAQDDLEELRTEIIQALSGTKFSGLHRQWRGWMSPQSMYALPSDCSRPEKWTPKKILTTEYSVALLATNLLLSLPSGSPNDSTTSQLQELVDTRAKILNNLTSIKARSPYDTRGLHRLSHPRYLYVYDTHDRKRTTAMLNRTLLHILQQHSSGNIELQEAVVKITYELLTSQHPPDVKTYTLLINRFSGLGQHTLVDNIIDSLHNAHVRMNEMTAADILTHYTRSKDLHGFLGFVSKLRGRSGGLMLAHPDTKMDVPETHRRATKIVAPFTPDARVYYTIIKGFLSFDDFPAASAWYAEMREQDIEPDMALKNDYLFFYAKNRFPASWRGGLATWKSIKRHLSNTQQTQLDRTHELNAYRRMMLLCKNHGKALAFKAVYREALSKGHSLAALLQLQPKYMPATPARDAAESSRRRLWVLERRVQKQEDELARLRLEAAASKLILAAESVAQLRDSLPRVAPVSCAERLHGAEIGRVPTERLWDGKLRLRSVRAKRKIKARPVESVRRTPTSKTQLAASVTHEQSSEDALRDPKMNVANAANDTTARHLQPPCKRHAIRTRPR